MSTVDKTQLEVMDKAKTFSRPQRELLTLARDCKLAGETFAEKYRAVIQYIRKEKMEADQIAPVLIAAGFAASRISEFKGIALGPDENADAYIQGKIGWRPALEMARTEKQKKKGKSKKQKKDAATAALFKAHSKLAAGNPKAEGWHCHGDHVILFFRHNDLAPAGSFFDCGNITFLVEKKTKATTTVAASDKA